MHLYSPRLKTASNPVHQQRNHSALQSDVRPPLTRVIRLERRVQLSQQARLQTLLDAHSREVNELARFGPPRIRRSRQEGFGEQHERLRGVRRQDVQRGGVRLLRGEFL